MRDTNIVFDHVHLISADPHAAAAWYIDKLGGEVVNSYDLRGAPQIHVVFNGATIGVRHGERWRASVATRRNIAGRLPTSKG